MRHQTLTWLTIAVLISGVAIFAQDSPPLVDTEECTPEGLAQQLITINEMMVIDFDEDPETARDNLFRVGSIYQNLAIQCGYIPNEAEVDKLIQQTLAFASIAELIEATSAGNDVENILISLENIRGDLFNGQLLYNGMANGLDGTPLGCSGCHSSEAAPLTEGTWTRITEIRLHDPALADYDVQQYLVESIVQPDVYVAPGFMPHLMPSNFGARIDLQMMADLIAYMDSQDQLLDD